MFSWCEGFQRTVIRQGNGLLQVERYPLLGKSGRAPRLNKSIRLNFFMLFLFYK